MGFVNTDRIAGEGHRRTRGPPAQAKWGLITRGEEDENSWYPAVVWVMNGGPNCLFLTLTRLLARQLGEVSGFAHAPLILAAMALVAMETSSR